MVDSRDELTLAVGETKVSVISYPFHPLHKERKTDLVTLFDIHDLASSKAYTIGRRGAWRDYVDMFAILNSGLRLDSIIKESEKRFGESFNAKLFLEQLTYFEDIHDFSIEWIAKKYPIREIQKYLQTSVLDFLKHL